MSIYTDEKWAKCPECKKTYRDVNSFYCIVNTQACELCLEQRYKSLHKNMNKKYHSKYKKL